MMRWDLQRTINGYTVMPDPDAPATWTVLPGGPRFRLDARGNPICFLYKYRSVIERPGGALAGGLFIADVVYGVPEADRAKIRATLQAEVDSAHGGADGAPQVRLADPTYTKGRATVQLADSGGSGRLVQKVQIPDMPALYGDLGLPITAELTPEGATFLQQAIAGGGPVLQVPYVMTFPVRMGDVTATIWFDAGKFMDFHQHAAIDWSFWGADDYRESITEQFRSSESGGVEIDPGPDPDSKVVQAVTDWAWRSLEDAVKRMVLTDIEAVSADDRKIPDGIENVWRDVSVSKVASFRRTFKQGTVMNIESAFASATLAPLTSLDDADGIPLDPAKFCLEVDLDDPFLQTLRVTARANADFATLPIDSVEVKLRYADEQPREFSLRSPDDLARYEQYTDGRGYKYAYSYQVNYTGESRRFEAAETVTDEQVLTVNVGDTGILDVEVVAGDLDFTQITRARVELEYEDADQGIAPVQHTVSLDQAHPTARIQAILFAPVDKPYRHRVVYELAGGKDLAVDHPVGYARQLYVNDPFSDTRTVGMRGFGDFDSRIGTIFLNLRYADDRNAYVQTTTVALSKTKPFADWSFPVLDADAGVVTYSGTITYQGGGLPEDIPEQTAVRDTVMVGDVPRVVTVLGDLVDLGAVKLAKVTMRYTDPAHAIDESKDFILKAGAPGPFSWSHSYEKGADPAYTVTVQYFLTGGGSRTVGPLTTADDTFLVPEVVG